MTLPNAPQNNNSRLRDGNARDTERRDDGPRVNRAIRSPNVRLIDPNGEMLGVMTTRDAIVKAQEFGLDLVEISPNAEPPVCKILDYGKYKYEEQKKKKEAKKKQKVIEVKEMKLRPQIDDHDLMIKVRQMREFLLEGDKVKVSVRLRGREAANKKLAMDIFARVQQELQDCGKTESEPRPDIGGIIVMMVVPK